MATVTRILAETADTSEFISGDAIAISPDGRYAVFAQQTVSGATVEQIELEDLQTGATTLVSASATGTPGDGGSSLVGITADDNTVFFTSTATNLVPGYVPPKGSASGYTTLYAKTLSTGAVSVVAAPNPNDQPGEAAAVVTALSAPPGGQFVAYTTDYEDSSGQLLDTRLVYQNLKTGQIKGALLPAGAVSLLQPSISSDGTWLVYQTYTPSSFGVRGGRDVWLENTVTQTTLRISQTADGRPASDLNLTSDPEPGSVISADGSTVAFYSAAPLLGTNQPGIYEYDVRTGTLSLVIPGLIGIGADIINLGLSSDGRYLAAPDGVYDRVTGTVESVVGVTDGKISDDGHYLIDLGYSDADNADHVNLVDLRPPTVAFGDLGPGGVINAALKAADLVHGITVTGLATNVEAGNLVSFTLNGLTQTTAVQSDGTWSVTLSAATVAALAEGSDTAQASVQDNGGTLATATEAVLVDTVPPSEFVSGLVIGDKDVITAEVQLAGPTTAVTGTLSAPLAAGDRVVVVCGGQDYTATIDSTDPTKFLVSVRKLLEPYESDVIQGTPLILRGWYVDRREPPPLQSRQVAIPERSDG